MGKMNQAIEKATRTANGKLAWGQAWPIWGKGGLLDRTRRYRRYLGRVSAEIDRENLEGEPSSRQEWFVMVMLGMGACMGEGGKGWKRQKRHTPHTHWRKHPSIGIVCIQAGG